MGGVGSKEPHGKNDARHAQRHQLARMAKETHFTLAEVQTLHQMFKNYGSGNVIKREDLRKALRSDASSEFSNRVFDLLDREGNNVIDFREFCCGLSSLCERASVDEKLEYSFKLYDLDGTGSISRKELAHILRASLQDSQDESDLSELVDKVFKEADTKKNNKITFSDYKNMVLRNPQFLRNLTLSSSMLATDFRNIMKLHDQGEQWKNYLKLGNTVQSERAKSFETPLTLDDVLQSVSVQVNSKYVPQRNLVTLPVQYSEPTPFEFHYDFGTEKEALSNLG